MQYYKQILSICSFFLLVGLCYDFFESIYTLIGFANTYFIGLALFACLVFSASVIILSIQANKFHQIQNAKTILIRTLIVGNTLITTGILIWYLNLANISGNRDSFLANHYTKPNHWETNDVQKISRNAPRVVISLSTLPNRVFKLNETLESLLNQTVKPDAIYVNLPKYSERLHVPYPEYSSPFEEVTVLDTPDYGPLTKLLPAIYAENDPDTIIITVDDDRIYRNTLVEDLVYHAQRNPSAAIGSGWSIMRPVFPSGMAGIYPTKEVLQEHKEGVLVDVLQGFAGVAYRRKFFDPERLKQSPEACFTLDDVYISGYLSTVSQAKKVSIGSRGVKKVFSKEEAAKDQTRLGYINHHGDNRRFIKCIEAIEREFGHWETINY